MDARRTLIGAAVVVLLLTVACGEPAEVAQPEPAEPPVGEVKASVTILTTNAADLLRWPAAPNQGEWSFAAWVEVEGRSFLFDTGWSRSFKCRGSRYRPLGGRGPHSEPPPRRPHRWPRNAERRTFETQPEGVVTDSRSRWHFRATPGAGRRREKPHDRAPGALGGDGSDISHLR